MLTQNGHNIDILITSKDVLEDLIINEGWSYTNIFPKGRKLKVKYFSRFARKNSSIQYIGPEVSGPRNAACKLDGNWVIN